MNQFLIESTWWIPIYSFFGAFITIPWSLGVIHRTGPRPAAYINLITTITGFIHSLIIFKEIWHQPIQYLEIPWFKVAELNLTFTLEISAISVGAVVMVTGFSLLAQIYAVGYMEKDWALARFFGLMGFFEGAISGLAMSDSLLLSYGLLEMLTLSTYLLVGFWYAQPLVVTAARDAFLTKRVGDLLLLMGVVALSSFAGSLNFSDLADWANSESASNLGAGSITLIGLALIAGPTGKCAQFPLHLWLDEAMEGPSPASILRNTLVVSAGAYVLIKLQPVFALSPLALGTLVGLGSATAIGASLVAIAQIDIKRALSHTTSAFLGLVFIAVGMQQTNLAFLLLFTHAFGKALLFMSVGAIISTTNNQNMGEMGGLWSRMPATVTAFGVGAASLVGCLPLGCYFSLQLGVSTFLQEQPLLALVFILTNGITALGLTRMFRLLFLGEAQPKTKRAPEVGWLMALPMVSLTIVTLLIPLITKNLLLIPEATYFDFKAALILVFSGIVGCLIGSTVYLHRTFSRPMNVSLRFLQDFLAYDLYVDRLYRFTVVFAVSLLSRVSNWCDRYIIDGLVNLTGIGTLFGAETLKYNVPGPSQIYVLVMFLSLTILGILMNWSNVSQLVNVLSQ